MNRIALLFANFNTSLRMPTFTDLYYSGPTIIGNPDLKPELTAALEGGIKLNSPIARVNLVLYYRKGKDVIDWVKTNEQDKWQPGREPNISVARVEGLTPIDNELRRVIPVKDFDRSKKRRVLAKPYQLLAPPLINLDIIRIFPIKGERDRHTGLLPCDEILIGLRGLDWVDKSCFCFCLDRATVFSGDFFALNKHVQVLSDIN